VLRRGKPCGSERRLYGAESERKTAFIPMKNKDYDKKMFRLLAMVRRLEAGKVASTREFAEEFNVHHRTVQRDLELLNQAGFLVTSPEKGLHTFEKGFSLRKTELSSEEASLLAFFYEIARSLGGRFEESFQTILKKVLHRQHESPYYAKIPHGLKLDKEYPFIGELEDAVADSKKIELTYRLPDGTMREYPARPLKIVFFEGFWYLIALVTERDWIVKYRLDRVTRIKALDRYFKVPKNLQAMLDESVNVWFDKGPLKKVVLKVDKEAARFFIDAKYFPRQKIKRNRDGSLTIRAVVSSDMEILPNLMRWIPMVTVVSPKDLKALVRAKIASYLKKL